MELELWHQSPAVPAAPGELRGSPIHSHISTTVFPQTNLGPIKTFFEGESFMRKLCSSVFISTLVWLSASLKGHETLGLGGSTQAFSSLAKSRINISWFGEMKFQMSSSEWPHYGKNISFVCQCYFLFLSCLICSHFCNTAHREKNSWCTGSPLYLHQKSALFRKLKPQQTCRGWKCLAKHFGRLRQKRVFVRKEGLHVSCLKPAEHTAMQKGFLLKLLLSCFENQIFSLSSTF